VSGNASKPKKVAFETRDKLSVEVSSAVGSSLFIARLFSDPGLTSCFPISRVAISRTMDIWGQLTSPDPIAERLKKKKRRLKKKLD
jgi:hypothetical protein